MLVTQKKAFGIYNLYLEMKARKETKSTPLADACTALLTNDMFTYDGSLVCYNSLAF